MAASSSFRTFAAGRLTAVLATSLATSFLLPAGAVTKKKSKPQDDHRGKVHGNSREGVQSGGHPCRGDESRLCLRRVSPAVDHRRTHLPGSERRRRRSGPPDRDRRRRWNGQGVHNLRRAGLRRLRDHTEHFMGSAQPREGRPANARPLYGSSNNSRRTQTSRASQLDRGQTRDLVPNHRVTRPPPMAEW